MEKINKIQQISGPQALPLRRPLSSRQHPGKRGSQRSGGDGGWPLAGRAAGTGRGGWELPQGRMLGGETPALAPGSRPHEQSRPAPASPPARSSNGLEVFPGAVLGRQAGKHRVSCSAN